MVKLKRIHVMSAAKFFTILGAGVGLILGIIYSIGGFFVDLFTTGLNYGTLLAMQALIGMPIIFAAFGLATGIVLAIVYNISSKWIGKLEIN